jgi:meso-butanediol dehydrogenase / (S,S)-butanediol dehydrogenase / diacetyl reductase
VAIVTGGSRGIGAACVKRLAGDGYRVLCSGRDADALEAMRAGLPTDRQDHVKALACDSRDPESAGRLVDEAVAAFGGVDAVIANSGTYLAARVAETTPDDWDNVIRSNLSSVLWLIQAALPELRRRGGYLIAIGSVSGTRGFEDEGAYGASKRALRILTDSVTREEASSGVRASLVSPGVVRTAMAAQAFRSAAYGADGDVPGLVEPSDIADTIAYLLGLSPGARIDEVVVGDSRWAYA